MHSESEILRWPVLAPQLYPLELPGTRSARAGMQSDVIAAAADLGHVAEFLQALGRGIRAVEESPAESGLRREAEGWAERLGRVAGEIRAAVEAAP